MNLTINQITDLVELKKNYQALADEISSLQKIGHQLVSDKCDTKLNFSMVNQTVVEQNKADEFLYATPDHYMDIERAYIRSLMQKIEDNKADTGKKQHHCTFKHTVTESTGLRIIAIIIEEKQNQVMAIKKQMEDIIISDIRITVTELPTNPITDLHK